MWCKQSNRNLLSKGTDSGTCQSRTSNLPTQQPTAAYILDSASYKITGTKTKYTIKEGETLTRVSLRFYGTKSNVAIHCETQSRRLLRTPTMYRMAQLLKYRNLQKNKSNNPFTRSYKSCIDRVKCYGCTKAYESTLI